MLSGKQIHGLRVIDQNNNELGVVDDLIANKESGKIIGFVVTLPGILANSAYVPINEVVRFDLTGLVVAAKSSLSRMKKAKQQVRNKGVLAMRRGGFTSDKGYITDIIVEKDRIASVEITQGVLNDLREGRKIIPWDDR